VFQIDQTVTQLPFFKLQVQLSLFHSTRRQAMQILNNKFPQ